MKIGDRLYKQFIKSKNNQTREIKQAAFKKYQNKVTDLFRISRQSLYQNYFSGKIRKTQRHYDKESMKLFIQKKAGKTNSSSSLLINQKPVTNQKDMAEHFNIFSHPLVKIFKKVVSNRATQDTFSSLK